MSVTPKVFNPLSPFKILHYKTEDADTAKALLEVLQREIHLQYPNVCPLSPVELLQMGAVYVDGNRCFKNQSLKFGQILKVHLQPKRFPEIESCTHERIVFENSEFLVLNKPSGVPIHATRDNYFENALERTKKITGIKLYVTHRLDTETRGLTIFAKTPEVQRALNAEFSSGRVAKFYRLETSLALPLGDLVHFTDPEPSIPRRFSKVQETEAWKICHLRVVESNEVRSNRFLSKVQLITGRTHQIRGQMGVLENPIIGDLMYGSNIKEDLQLECVKMDFSLSSTPYSFKL